MGINTEEFSPCLLMEAPLFGQICWISLPHHNDREHAQYSSVPCLGWFIYYNLYIAQANKAQNGPQQQQSPETTKNSTKQFSNKKSLPKRVMAP